MVKPYHFRQAQTEDLIPILALFRGTIEVVCSHDYASEQLRAWIRGGRNSSKWLSRIQDQYFILCYCEETLVGFTSLARDGYLDLLYVHKNWQRRGVARGLMDEIYRYAASNKMTMLTSHVSITAVPFFLRYGFSVHQTRHEVRDGVILRNMEVVKVLTALPPV